MVEKIYKEIKVAKKLETNYRDVLASIKKGELAPLYILMGEEDYYIDMIMDALESRVVAEEDKDFDFNLFYGVDADMDSVVAAAQQLPMMSERRLVLLKEAQSKPQAKQQLDKIAPYALRPNPQAVLAVAFKGDTLGATSALVKNAVKGDAVVLKCDRLKDYQLPAAVRDYCTVRKVGIEEKAVDMLCEYIGGPLTKLYGELNKLIQIKNGSGERITAADVERNIGISKDFNNFELTAALVSRNYPKAVQIIKYFKANSKANPTMVTTATLFNYFSRLVIAHYLPDKSDAALREAFNLKFQKQITDLKDGMRAYNAYKAVNAVHFIREFDVKSKGVDSYQNEYDLLLELIFKIFTV